MHTPATPGKFWALSRRNPNPVLGLRHRGHRVPDGKTLGVVEPPYAVARRLELKTFSCYRPYCPVNTSTPGDPKDQTRLEE
jgi:hypothetical protein